MTKQEQINEMLLYVPQTIVAYDANPKGQHLYGEQRQQIAKALYDAGYRKIKEKNETLEEQIKHLNTIVERLDELLGKGIDEYIKGIDGVEGLKDMWERSAVRAFAEKLKTRLEAKEKHYICMYDWNGLSALTDCENEVDELLKEYE